MAFVDEEAMEEEEGEQPLVEDGDEVEGEAFVEMDPTGRYGRYPILLGEGSSKKVYRGFDLVEGIEIAWNQVHLSDLTNNNVVLDETFAEIRLLRAVHHENILKLYSCWTDPPKLNVNFITEICTSGSLRDYRRRHPHVSLKALKKWSLQILHGLDYLHGHRPCIIHRDLNLSNVFINGNTGEVLIGDFGVADAVARRGSAMNKVVGTPVYCAPELFNGKYTEKVDVYSFGLCVLEMVTMELPYSECGNFAMVYNNVMNGVKPRAFYKVTDPEVRAFIQRCIAPCDQRPSVTELLQDPFFKGITLEQEDYYYYNDF